MYKNDIQTVNIPLNSEFDKDKKNLSNVEEKIMFVNIV